MRYKTDIKHRKTHKRHTDRMLKDMLLKPQGAGVVEMK